MQIVTMPRRAGMALALDLLKQLDPDRPGDIMIELPEDARIESKNIMYRQALSAIANGACLCADDSRLCAACLAKSMLEPMPAGRVAEVFRVRADDDIDCPLGAVPSVAGAVEDDDSGLICDD